MALTASAPAGRAASSYITVPAGGNLQAALDAAQPGDTILLEPGATFVGNFVLPAKSSATTAYITIRSAASDTLLPAQGVRMNPSFAPHLPKLRSPNSMPALATAPWAHHYRLQFLEFLANAQGAQDILTLGDGSSNQNSLGMVPHNLVVDRVYIHGDVTVGQKRGIALNSAATSIVNSYISEIKAAGQDSQAIGGWNGPGPYLISNNYLEAAGENVMFGGADPAIVDLVPSDITFTRNHLFKPLSWRGTKWTIKNLFELKNAQRVVIDGNVMENNWLAAQTGYAVLFKSENQDGGAPWSVVQDVRFTNNLVRHVSSAINILGKATYPAVELNRLVIRNNLFEDVSAARYGGSGRLLMINGGSDITVDHNTAIIDGWSAVYADGKPSVRFTFTNNIVQDHSWAIIGSGTGVGNSTIAVYFPYSQFLGGIFVGSNPSFYPPANFYPPTVADVGFVNFAGGDYRLASTSIYRAGGTDGTDPGYNAAALANALVAAAAPAPAPVKLLTTSLPGGLAGTPYAQTLAAEGGLGTYTWALIAGALPAGLSLRGDGVISGTPSAAGSSAFTIRVSDAADSSRADSRDFTIAISLSVAASNLAPTVVMTTASGTVTVDKKVWLSADAKDVDGSVSRVEFRANGVLVGTDTAAPYAVSWTPSAPGTFSMTATAVDNRGATATSAPVVLIVEAVVRGRRQ
jgi:hypothetical protein